VVRGIHGYAWQLLLLVLGAHLAGAFLLGAYKAPWQKVWVSGVLAMLLVPAFIITGDLLPWNQTGYWATRVRLSIAASVPLVGEPLVGLLGAHSQIGIVTLTRFYVLHILFLPLLFALGLAAHLVCIRQGLQASPPADTNGGPRGSLLAGANRGLLWFLVVAVLLGLAAWERPLPLGDPADPTDTAYVPRPEWWVLPLNQLVTIFRGPLMVVGTVLIPGGLVGLLLALPFLDRSPERHPARRKTALLAAAGLAALLMGLSLMGYYEHYVVPREQSGAAGRTAGRIIRRRIGR
jgi:ubiquinol-cytochrome c reductase cytochrome b subunit